MTYAEIEAFLEIIQAGSMSKAAAKLYITQPALSRRLRQLEDELQYSLFIREKGTRNLKLTPRGEAFMSIAEKWMALWADSRALVGMNERINLSATAGVCNYLLPSTLSNFLQNEPFVDLSLHECSSYISYELMEKKQSDFAFVAEPRYSNNVETIPVLSEKMVLVCAAGGGYAESIHPSQLDPRREIHVSWNAETNLWHNFWFGSARPHVVLNVMTLLEYLLLQEKNWAIVPASCANYVTGNTNLEIHTVAEPPQDRVIYLLKCGEHKAPLIKKFMAVFHEQIEGRPGLTLLMNAG